MPITTIIDGLGRKTLFSGNATTIPGSTGLGTFDVSRFSRFVGMYSGTGSVTLQWRMGVQSGTYLVTSSTVINSGPNVFETLNYGKFSQWTISAANSQVPSFILQAEPLR